jgi:cysteine desulfuration protein SufE
MSRLPTKLTEFIDFVAAIPDRADRVQFLIDVAGRFEEVPERIARRPFPEEHRTPACESQAFVWAEERGDGTLDFHFAVENPQGISARAMAVILRETLSGAPPEQVLGVSGDVVGRIFGEELSMGKNMGLRAMISMVQNFARRLLERDQAQA